MQLYLVAAVQCCSENGLSCTSVFCVIDYCCFHYNNDIELLTVYYYCYFQYSNYWSYTTITYYYYYC